MPAIGESPCNSDAKTPAREAPGLIVMQIWPRRQADASDSNSSVGAEMDGLRSLIFARAARTPAP